MQETVIINFIDNVILNDFVSHAYLFEVDNYADDYQRIIDFSKALFCDRKKRCLEIANCTECNICRLIDDDNYPDLILVEPDGKEIKKNQMLWLINELNSTSIIGKRRVCIIKNAEKMNLFASNSILKFLEEPSENVTIILLTTNKHMLLDTIVSRCQCFNFHSDKYDFSEEEKISSFLKFIADKSFFINYKTIMNEILIDKENTIIIFKNLKQVIFKYITTNVANNKSDLVSLKKIDFKDLIRYIYILDDSIIKLNYNLNFKLFVDSFFSKMIGGDNNG